MKKRIISVVAVVLVIAMMATVLVACAPKTVPDAEAKLKKAGYTVLAVESPIVINGLKGNVTGTMKDAEKDVIYKISAFYYDTKDNADAAYAAIEADYKADKAAMKEAYQNEKDEDKKAAKKAAYEAYNIKKSGQWIAFGDKKAIGKLFGF